MHRFWTFPSILGGIGAVLPVFTLVQAWMLSSVCVRRQVPFMRWYVWLDLLDGIGLWMPRVVAVGAGLGLLVGLAEMGRFRDNDRDGMRAAWRLFSNVLWLGVYTLLIATSFVLVLFGLQGEGYLFWLWSWRSFSDFAALVLLIVNLLAMLWATIRTVTADDVLSPRVLAGRWRASTRLIE